MAASGTTWTFLSNHAHVLVCLSRNPDLRLRDLAVQSGITERGVQRIVHELVKEGYLELLKEGRRNHYRLVPERPLRHPLEQHTTIGELLCVLSPASDVTESGPQQEGPDS